MLCRRQESGWKISRISVWCKVLQGTPTQNCRERPLWRSGDVYDGPGRNGQERLLSMDRRIGTEADPYSNAHRATHLLRLISHSRGEFPIFPTCFPDAHTLMPVTLSRWEKHRSR